ncbi:3,4-dihydroxy-2-butanone-4-phosphate synthase [Citricoccus muralis]|uniref:3,4-dihydroxy-2-butanone-4-phosphate synthase n=1 Tax=Citricoccus muralis TaxID=169134 RepID=UPI003D6B10EE
MSHAALPLSSIEDALAAVAAGRPVIVADDEDRENEGDVILSAQLASAQWIAWTVAHSSGLLCAPMSNDIADQLDLPMMVARNEDVRSTAYTVTVDAARGVTTGISAHDRARTVQVLADPESGPRDVNRPGHILPLRAVDGGVRARAGHTEAAVELMRLSGLREVGVIAEIVAEDGDMMRLPGLIKLGAEHDIPVITIEALISYLNANENIHRPDEEAGTAPAPVKRRVSLHADTLVPTHYGELRMMAFRDRRAGVEHLALVSPGPDGALPADGALVRVHSECLTGEVFGSLKCECGPQLETALAEIAATGGVLIYMRGHEGRGIGLANKLRAYQLQESGLDTIDANLELGLPVDSRDYEAAAEMLQHLGLARIRLLTNNPDKVEQLQRHGIQVTEHLPLVVGRGEHNAGYLDAKRDRLRHTLPFVSTTPNPTEENFHE